MNLYFQKADPLQKQNQSLFPLNFCSGASDADRVIWMLIVLGKL